MKNEPPQDSDSALRTPWCWILLPVMAYLVAVPFLGYGALFVPVVVLNAPLGIIGCFTKVTMNSYEEWWLFGLVAHGAFWILLFTGLSGRKSLPARKLRRIWWILVVALLMSISGCAIHLGPGLRNEHNWH